MKAGPEGNEGSEGAGPRVPPARADARLTLITVAILGAYALVYGVSWIAKFSGINDFFVFWSAARWVGAHGLTPGVYEPETFRAFQSGLLPQAAETYRTFGYPPTGLLVMAPLGMLPLLPALALFLGASFAVYLAAVAWGKWRRALALAAAPATLMNIVIGQNGFLTAGLLHGGLSLAARRPWAAGALIGLLAIKPQLGLLVPIALLAARQWTCLIAAVVCTLAFAGASAALGGPEIWATWFRLLPVFAANTAANIDSASRLMVSPAAVFLTLGFDFDTARLLHLPIALGGAFAVWHVCRRYGLCPLSIAAVLTASLLVTPFAYFYDMTLAAAAVAIVVEEALKTGFRSGERFVLLFAWVAPLMAVTELRLSWAAPLALALLLLVIWRRLAAGSAENGTAAQSGSSSSARVRRSRAAASSPPSGGSSAGMR